MRRALALIAALAAFVPASAALASPTDVIRDCTDDEILQGGPYTQKELAGALAKLGADSAEYTNCAAVIHNAQLAAAGTSSGAKKQPGGTSTTPSTPGTTTTPSGTATTPTTPNPKTAGNAPGPFGGFSGYPKNPAADATAAEREALADARNAPASAQHTELAASTLPAPLIGALAAGGIGLLVLLLLDLRRRVGARRG